MKTKRMLSLVMAAVLALCGRAANWRIFWPG